MLSKRMLGLVGLGLAALWGAISSRLTFGAVPERVTVIFDGS